jgi:hypothetical protein
MMGGEYTYMGTQTLETIQDVADNLGKPFDEVMANIVKQHVDSTSADEK